MSFSRDPEVAILPPLGVSRGAGGQVGINAIVGFSLIVAGFADCAIAMFVLRPRIPDAMRRQVIVMAMVSGGAMMILLGGAIWAGVLDLEQPAPR
jgi:hypothetical protein